MCSSQVTASHRARMTQKPCGCITFASSPTGTASLPMGSLMKRERKSCQEKKRGRFQPEKRREEFAGRREKRFDMHWIIGTGWIHTHGMAERGFPEIEVRDVPDFLAESAAALLRRRLQLHARRSGPHQARRDDGDITSDPLPTDQARAAPWRERPLRCGAVADRGCGTGLRLLRSERVGVELRPLWQTALADLPIASLGPGVSLLGANLQRCQDDDRPGSLSPGRLNRHAH